jgi:uncharacterized protein YndB with AHSA1/START domain
MNTNNNTVSKFRGSAVVALPSDTEILITRSFDAPADLLFKTFTTPELVKRWWADPSAEWTVCDIDLRVGGQWRWVFRAGDMEVGFNGEYREVAGPRKLGWTEMWEGIPDAKPEDYAVNDMTLDEVDGLTTMTLLCTMPSLEARDGLLASGMEEGMQDSYDRLEEVARSAA